MLPAQPCLAYSLAGIQKAGDRQSVRDQPRDAVLVPSSTGSELTASVASHLHLGTRPPSPRRSALEAARGVDAQRQNEFLVVKLIATSARQMRVGRNLFLNGFPRKKAKRLLLTRGAIDESIRPKQQLMQEIVEWMTESKRGYGRGLRRSGPYSGSVVTSTIRLLSGVAPYPRRPPRS